MEAVVGVADQDELDNTTSSEPGLQRVDGEVEDREASSAKSRGRHGWEQEEGLDDLGVLLGVDQLPSLLPVWTGLMLDRDSRRKQRRAAVENGAAFCTPS
ncbi:hypothetical protein AYO20_09112 [Fonsecaea nubica]|uniref:Uncharacterized protein n=1 Tax=Fonsecaea nubica TaxID=856822 RepID=A0A178CID6_9EURO|nr:hypothetical protein AYO20_09112 [Fonsecaea nubica]OAL29728.1 hypothetical protein AYO20_09112 [Fonsecaea nubica]